jgi:16S rRNA (uracil1498-N3)-methyltransferase
MHSFFLAEIISGDAALISDAGQLHHLRDVLRLRIGDEIMVFDGEGNKYSGTIEGLDKKQAVLRLKARQPALIRRLRLAVGCAVPKQARMDDIIDKLTQLGVDSIIPLFTERCIVKPEETIDARLERWRKIARSASEQSHRTTLPYISRGSGFKEALADSKDYRLKLVPTLVGERQTLRELFTDSPPESIFVLIGPEGDFTPEEIQEAMDAGFIPVSLGDAVLRVETAAIAVASYIKLAFS